MAPALRLEALADLPLVASGDDLAALMIAAIERRGWRPQDQDILVAAQKIVSKAEGRTVDLATVTPSPEAEGLARRCDKDARLVQVILSESRGVVRAAPGVLIVEHRLGLIMANAGVDQSNVEDDRTVLLLPADPDKSAERLRKALEARFAVRLGVVIADSFGRPWRLGSCSVAIGAAGLPALLDRRGGADLFGRPLQVTQVALADQISAAASLLMGEGAEGLPAVLVRGLAWSDAATPASALLRPAERDLFR